MKKKTVKKVEHKKVKPKPKKIKVKHTDEVVKEVQTKPVHQSPAAVLPDEPVNLATSLPAHTPGLERC